MPRFLTEEFYEKYEFRTPFQLCNSDCETMSIGELLELADVPVEELTKLRLGYTEAQGNFELREAIARLYKTVAPDDVVVLGTPVEGIYLTARALCDPGDEVIALSPAYDALVNTFEHVTGMKCKKWTVDPSGLDAMPLTDKTKLVVVNFPHNPTGFLPTHEELTDLLAKKVPVFCDEMYFGLTHSRSAEIPSAADLGATVVLSGLSKTYGLPGLRTGWLIVKDPELRRSIMNWKFYTSICPPGPSEFLACAALKVHDKLRQRSLAQIQSNIALATTFFNQWPSIFHPWEPPRAGSTALVKLHVPSVTDLASRLATDAGVLIHPAITLGMSHDDHMRIGLGRQTFGDALSKFDAFLAAEDSRTS